MTSKRCSSSVDPKAVSEIQEIILPLRDTGIGILLTDHNVYDTLSVITLRLADRRNPMVGDTQHFSHRLLRRGMSPRRAVLTIYLATGATAIGASLLPHVTAAGAVLVFAQTIGIVLIIALLESSDPVGGKGRQ